MNVVDSSAWIEYFADGPMAQVFAPAIESEPAPAVSTLSLSEVFAHMLREYGRPDALRVAAAMRRGKVVDVSSALALDAAQLAIQHEFSMAHGIVLATARSLDAQLWTKDPAFGGIDHVCLVARR